MQPVFRRSPRARPIGTQSTSRSIPEFSSVDPRIIRQRCQAEITLGEILREIPAIFRQRGKVRLYNLPSNANNVFGMATIYPANNGVISYVRDYSFEPRGVEEFLETVPSLNVTLAVSNLYRQGYRIPDVETSYRVLQRRTACVTDDRNYAINRVLKQIEEIATTLDELGQYQEDLPLQDYLANVLFDAGEERVPSDVVKIYERVNEVIPEYLEGLN